jgi:apolipoprotein N-acyltransferase
MQFILDRCKLNARVSNTFTLEIGMNISEIPYPQKDRWSYLWLVVGTLVLFLWRMPLAWWLAPIFLLHFMRSQNIRRGFLLIWLSGFLAGISPMYSIINALIPTPLPVFLIIVAVFALMNTAIPYLADRMLALRLKGFAATLVFPLIVTTTGYIASKANPAGSIGGQAYFQYSNLALLQLLSITGMWGILFLVNWLGPVFNYAWERGFSWKDIRRNILIYAAIMLAVLLYGGVRLAYAPQASETVRIHGFTAVDMRNDMLPQIREAKQQGWQTYRQLSAELQDHYLEGTIREAQAGAQIVHWPEMAVSLAKEDEADFLARAGQIARDEDIYMVMGYIASFEDGSRSENKLVITDPAGEVVLEHLKYGGAILDGVIPGDGVLRTVNTPYGTISGIICNDTYHEEVVTQAGKNGTDLLFSPTMGWQQTDPLQAHMAMYRAIENGVTHVRMADNGLSIAVDPYGRVSATMDHFNSTEQVMVAQVPLLSRFTIYPYIGDLFAWLAIAGFIAILIWAVVIGRRRKQKQAVKPE